MAVSQPSQRPSLPRASSGPADNRRRTNVNLPVDPHELARRLEVARLEIVASYLRHKSRSQADLIPRPASAVRLDINVQDVQPPRQYVAPESTRRNTLARPKSSSRPAPLQFLNPETLVQELDAHQRKDMPSPQISPYVSSFPPQLKPQRSKENTRDVTNATSSAPHRPPQIISQNLTIPHMDGEISPQPATLGMFPMVHTGLRPGAPPRRPRSAPLTSVPITDFSQLTFLQRPAEPGAPPPIIRRGSHDRPLSRKQQDEANSQTQPQSKSPLKRPTTNFSRRRSSPNLLSSHAQSAANPTTSPPLLSKRSLRSRSQSSPKRPSTAPQLHLFPSVPSAPADPPSPTKRPSLENLTPASRALLGEQERRLLDLRRRQEKAYNSGPRTLSGSTMTAVSSIRGGDHQGRTHSAAQSVALSLLGDSTEGMTKESVRLLREKEDALRRRELGMDVEAERRGGSMKLEVEEMEREKRSVEREKRSVESEKKRRRRSCLCFW